MPRLSDPGQGRCYLALSRARLGGQPAGLNLWDMKKPPGFRGRTCLTDFRARANWHAWGHHAAIPIGITLPGFPGRRANHASPVSGSMSGFS
jgi:hypothetical protein